MAVFPTSLTATVRSLVRSPSYLIVSLVVLATSIAAQVTMTAVIEGMLLRPPSGAEPSRIKVLAGPELAGVVSYFDYTNEAERNHAFSSLFAFHTLRSSLATADDVTQVSVCVVSGTYFPTLGVQAASGRLIVPSDDIKGGAPVVVISSELSRQYGLGVGSTVRLNTTVFQVVGILPAGYEGIEKYVRTQVWLPMWQIGAVDAEWMLTHHDYEWVTVGGRLRPGVTEGQAEAETLAVSRQIAKEFPTLNSGGEMRVQSVFKFRAAQDDSIGAVLILFFLGWFLFALAFANFFALTLVRLVNRRRELAVRLSLGASRSDMGRWLIGELSIVSLGSVVSGFGLSHLFLWVLRRNPHFSELLERTQVRIDGPTFAVIVLAVAIGILAVWFVALRVIQRTDLVTAFKETSTAPKRQRAMVALFALQFGIVLFILAVADSLLGTLREVSRQRYPVRTENLLLTTVNLRSIGHADSQADSLNFMRSLMDRITAVPGVTAVSASTTVPLGWMGETNLRFEGKNPADEADQNGVSSAYVSPQFLTTIELPILLGRDMDAHDFRNDADVVVIDRVAAHRFFPNQNHLGKVFQTWTNGPHWVVVGVSEHLPNQSDLGPPSEIFIPFYKGDRKYFNLEIAVDRDSAAVRSQVQDAMRSLWPYHTVPELRSIQDQIVSTRDDLTSTVEITLWVSGFAMLITTIGFYFFSAYTVSLYLKDAAIRLALGARPYGILRIHLSRFKWGVIGGLLLGILMLLGTQALWAHFVNRIAVPQATSLFGAAIVMVIIGGLGLCLPLRRVNSMNSYHLLRSDAE